MTLIAERDQNFVGNVAAFVFRRANLLRGLRAHSSSGYNNHERSAQHEPEAFHGDAPIFNENSPRNSTRARNRNNPVQPSSTRGPGGCGPALSFLPERAAR